jgi:hypothetical protein
MQAICVEKSGDFDIIPIGTVEDEAASAFSFSGVSRSRKHPHSLLGNNIMLQPKAIETRYRGVLYRSRLEARWAVFFHHLNLDYSFEPEGFELPFSWYLPDFYVREWNAYVEIKDRDGYGPDAVIKGFELQQATGKMVILLVGRPYPGKYVGLTWPGDTLAVGGEFARCSHCDSGIALSRNGSHITLLDNGCFNAHSTYTLNKQLAEAYRAAISARFEHGEGIVNG